MAIVRTYFENRIPAAGLADLVERREPFFLENVANEDESARRFAALVEARGMTCRTDDQRSPGLATEAQAMLPLWIHVLVLVRQAVAGVSWRLGKPQPDYIVVMQNQALQVRCRKGRPAAHLRTP